MRSSCPRAYRYHASGHRRLALMLARIRMGAMDVHFASRRVGEQNGLCAPLVLSIANARRHMAAIVREVVQAGQDGHSVMSESIQRSPEPQFCRPVPYRSSYNSTTQTISTAHTSGIIGTPFATHRPPLQHPASCIPANVRLTQLTTSATADSDTFRESSLCAELCSRACPSFDMLHGPYRISFFPESSIASSCSWTPNQNDQKPAMQTCHPPDSSPLNDR